MNLTVPGNWSLQLDQDLGHAHQDGDVRIVAAGMHHAGLLACPLRPDLGRERHIDLLGHRERVHVGTQGHDRTGFAAAQHRDHAGVGHTRTHFEPQRLQVVGHQFRRPHLPIAQLRVLMDVAPPRNDFRFETGGKLIDFGRQLLSLDQGGRAREEEADEYLCHDFESTGVEALVRLYTPVRLGGRPVFAKPGAVSENPVATARARRGSMPAVGRNNHC